jgi:hypothetical protein
MVVTPSILVLRRTIMSLKVCCDALKKAVKNGPEAKPESRKPGEGYAYSDASKKNHIRHGVRDADGFPPLYSKQDQLSECPYCSAPIST